MSGGLYFDVWPADDPNGTALGELTEAYAKTYQSVHQAMGSGQLTINRHDAQAAWVVADNLVRVRRVAGGPFAYDDPRYIGAFWLESGKRNLLSAAEEGGNEITLGGRGPEACLRWALLYPDNFATANTAFTHDTRKDGNWHIPNRTAGEVLSIFLRDLPPRSPDPLPFLSKDFNNSTDSNGQAWSDTDTDWTIPVGTNGLDLLATCVSGGLFYRVGADFEWHAYEDEPGEDLHSSIVLTEGEEISEAADQDIQAREVVGRVVVQGTKANGGLKYLEVVNAPTEAALPGRREGFVEYRRTPTNSKLTQAGNRYIRKTKRRHDGPLQLRIVERTGAEAFTDFVAGDIIAVDIPGVFSSTALRVYSISLEEDEAGNVDPVLEFEQQPFDPNSGDAEFDDGKGDGANCGDCPPIPPYVPEPIPGDDETTSGGVLWKPGNNGGSPAATSWLLHWASDGDNPDAGYPGPGGGGPIDATSFAYIGPNDDRTGFTVLRAGSLDIHLETDFADVATLRDYTLELRLNGATIGSDSHHHDNGGFPGFATALLTVDIAAQAVGVGDVLEVYFLTSELSGAVVPAGTGATSNRLQILGTSTTHETTTPAPLEGQGHAEQLTGDGSTTEFQTNYPYAPGSLQVWVDGLLTPVAETDPTTGTFTFETAPGTGAVIIVRYQNAGTTGTGASNPQPEPSTPSSSGGITVQDEGSPLATLGTTLNFVGAGVAATGTGATKTITVSEPAAATVASDLAAHLADTTDAHDASAISVLDSGAHFAATDVEAALLELYNAVVAAAAALPSGSAVGDRLRWTGSAWAASRLAWSPVGVNVPTLVTTDGAAVYVPLTTSDGQPVLAEVLT